MLLVIEDSISVSESQKEKNMTNKVENVSINITLNPDVLSVGGSGKLFIKISNSGNLNASVNSMQLAPSWNQSNINQNFIVKPNRTFFESVALKIPDNITSGKYTLDFKASTSLKDYDANAVLNISRIETLPLSDNIPLSILVVIFSGVLTYSIAAYIITHSFQRSYIEIALWSAGLGFLNWGILSVFASQLRIRTTLELIQYDFYAVVMILIIGILVGFMAGLFQKFVISSILALLREKNIIKERQTSFRQRGFWQSEAALPVWPYFISEEWDFIKQNLGKNYSTTLKVYLKNQINERSYLTGILGKFENVRSPYDMVLYPKYTVDSTRSELVARLRQQGELGRNLIYEMFEDDSEYLKKVTDNMKKEFSLTGNSSIELSIEILNLLQSGISNDDCNQFHKVLERIDFSKYVSKVIERMQQTPITSYDGPLYIQGENILNIELVCYESYESIRLVDCAYTITPKVYDKSRFPLVTSVTAY